MNKKILYVEDEPSVLAMVLEVFKMEGFDVRGAGDGAEALQAVYDFRPDIIISDIAMPVMDGLELLERLRENEATRGIPLIFLTARSDRSDFRQAMGLGADDYLTKPFAVDELLSAVYARLKRRAEILGIPDATEDKAVKRLRHHIFLSYSRVDVQMMRRVKSSFKEINLSVWTDEELTPGTEAWTQAIEEAIELSGCLAVILSPDAKQSVWVKRELSYAKIHQIPIFPILAKGDERTALPLEIVSAQLVDIRSDYQAQFEKLVRAIKGAVGIYG